MAEKVSARAKATDQAGRVVTLKLKLSDHKSISRRLSLHHPTQLTDTIYRTARSLFDQVGDKGAYRLLGAKAEQAADKIRERFGAKAIIKGRALR